MKGSCLCGAVGYEVTETPVGTNYCHCRQCRKASGTAFATNSAVNRSAFRVLDEGEVLVGYESSPGKHRHFCGQCGSPIYSSYKGSPDVVCSRIGTLDDNEGIKPDIHIHVASKAPWYKILDALPKRQEEEDLWF